MTNWKLARRDLLKGLGVGAAMLPLLHATKAFAQGGNTRFVVLQMSEGLRITHWRPQAGALAGQTLPYSSQAFDAFKSDMIFIPDLNNPGGGGGHGSYGCIYYGLGSTGGGQYKEPTGKTVDQVIADGLPQPASGRRSIHLHVQLDIKPTSTPSPGGRRAFWAGAGKPINPVGDPYTLYKEIFGGGPPATPMPGNDPGNADVKKMLGEKKSILDYVGKSLESFKARLGNEDKESISAHTQSIRELEMQLSAAPADGSCAGGAPGMFDMENQAHYPMILKAHTNLIVAALKCGVTRVATLQTGDSSGNNINFAFVDVDGKKLPERSKNNYKSPFRNWHDLGHNPIMDGEDHKRLADKWFFQRWAEMFTAMKAVAEPGGSMFDNTVVLIGNHVEDGGNHNTGKTPWMLAGGKAMNYFNLGTCTGGAGPVKGVMANICEAFKVTHPFGGGHGGVKKA